MIRDHDYRSNPRKSMKSEAKRDSSVGFALALVLTMALCVSLAVASSSAPRPVGMIEKPGTVWMLDKSAGAAWIPCTTLTYAGDPAFYFPIPDGAVTALSMRFTPVSQDTLKEVTVSVYDPGDGSWGNDTIKISIYSDEAGLPGTQLASRKISPGSYFAYPTPTVVSFASDHLVFSSDFHIGISTSAAAGSGRYESILSDSGVPPHQRSSYFAQSQWHRYADQGGPDYNFVISATMCSPTCYATSDANNDGTPLSISDLSYLIAFIHACGPTPPVLYSCNLNGDGIVDTMDIKIFQNYFTFGMSVFAPYGGYPVPCPCNPTPVPVPDTVEIFGLEHVSAGPTCLATGSGGLLITRFMATMAPEGVVIDVPDAISSPPSSIVWRGELQNPDPGGALPVGAWLEAQLRGKDIIRDSICISTTKTAANSWNLGVRSRATTYTVKAFNNGSQVFSGTDNGASGLGSIVETAKGVYPVGYKGTTSGKPASVIVTSDFDFAASPSGVHWTWAAHGVANLTIDYLSISSEHDTTFETLSSVGIYARQMDSIRINSETYSFSYGNVMVAALGNATITPVDTTLVIGNIGSSGLDGMDAESDDKDGDWSIVVANPDPLGTFPVGASIQVELNRYESILSDSTCLSMSKAAANNWSLAVRSRATTYTVKAFNNGSQVFSGTDNGASGLGSIVETAKGVYPVGYKGTASGKPASVIVTSDYDFTASPSGVRWTWAAHAVANLTIDYLNISAELAGPNLSGITHAEIFGDNGAKADPISFTILDIEVVPSYICGDANGSGAINISDVVYLINYIFSGGNPPNPLESGDANCSGLVNISDAVYLVNYIFSGGAAPCAACP